MLKPLEWQDRPALIEHLFPVQKLSVESYKEQEARQSKTLTALGSYWKGRKPLILNKACILGALLPTTDDSLQDLEMFELLMGMDAQSLAIRQGRIKPNAIAQRVSGLVVADWFEVTPEHADVPDMTPFDVNDFPCEVLRNHKKQTVIPKLSWRHSISEQQKLHWEAQALPYNAYRNNVSIAKRPEELSDEAHQHIWPRINAFYGTNAISFPEFIEQIGIARFGHRPRVADVFCGSGQIPFEAARLGCDVYASDLNPIACMLTWGAFHIVGASPEQRLDIDKALQELAEKVKAEIDALGVETDSQGYQAKFYLYCTEVVCPETGYAVPILPNRIISKDWKVVLDIVPDVSEKRYNIVIRDLKLDEDLNDFLTATYSKGEVIHSPDNSNQYRFKISAIRGDYKEGKENKNRLRQWEKSDFMPRPDDIFQERLYCVQWMRPKPNSKQFEYQFRAVSEDDLKRERIVTDYVAEQLVDWQEQGFIPDSVIEKGYNTDQPIRERGWTHWHHLFNARQLLWGAMCMKHANLCTLPFIMQTLNWNARLSRWDRAQVGGGGSVKDVFYNQALNTLFDYGCRATVSAKVFLGCNTALFPITTLTNISSHPAQNLQTENDLYITDPPYGDAVKYEEITEFFIAWLRKNPPKEFAHWTWDSRRTLAIKGEDEGFRQGMIAAYRNMAKHMPDHGLQVLMFTHQSGAIWSDMTTIIWASGLQVTAAWYVVTETDSALRQGANVKGTIILILRKRHQQLETFRDDLGWEIEDAVKEQVESLIGLDKSVRAHHPEGLYTDADLQMAGYAAAVKVLTAYSVIDGKDMVTESEQPRRKGIKTFVDELIDFAVQTAVQFLVPVGFDKGEWQKMTAVERFYLKMAEMEHQNLKTLDNYQNFAKAFKVHHFDQLLSDSSKANSARLKLGAELKGNLMSGNAEIANTPLRSLLYALFEIQKDVEVEDVLLHLMENCPNYLANKKLLAKMADYLAEKRGTLKPGKTFKPDQEASAARILAEAIRNQKL